jgi:hypothetical protein
MPGQQVKSLKVRSMARKVPKPDPTRSQYWLQRLINVQPDALMRQLASSLALPDGSSIDWRSPRSDDEYAEYGDDAFLDRLRIMPKTRELSSFWPKGGPNWDGLGITSRNEVLLVEAKAHIAEMASPASRAQGSFLAQIHASLTETKIYLGIKSEYDWAGPLYQVTNRLVHLYFLRILNSVPAYLVNIYFVNAPDVPLPATRQEWEGAKQLEYALLGTGHRKLSKYIVDVFVGTRELKP